MKKIIVSLLASTFLFALFSSPALAEYGDQKREAPVQDTTFHFLLEPVIGYQFVKRSYPTDHTQGIFIYGARVVAGSQLIAGEAQYEHGSASESFNTPSFITINTTRDIARLGVRTVFPLFDELHLIGRIGYQASHDGYDITQNNVTTSSSPSWEFHPYVGAGMNIYLLRALSFSVEATYVFDVGVETAAGFRIYF